MTKKILVALIAVAMLFAFTACDTQSANIPQGVSYITIRQTADIIEGQPFNAGDFEVVLHDSNGSEKGTIDGESIVTKDGDWFADHKVSASLKTSGGIYSTQEITLDAKLTASVEKVTSVSAVTGVEVSYSTSESDFVANYAEGFDRDSFTFTMNYNGGSASFTGADLAELKLTVVDADGDEVVAPVDGTTYNVVLSRYRFAGTENGKADQEVVRNIPTNLTVTYTKPATAVLESIVMGYYEKTTKDNVATYTAIPADEQPRWIDDPVTNFGEGGDTKSFYVLGNYSDGTVKELTNGNPGTGTADTYTIVSGSIPTKLPKDATTLSIVSNDVPSLNTPSFTFEGEDYIKSVEFKKASDFPKTFTTEDELTKAMFTATATYASDDTDDAFTDFELLKTTFDKEGNNQKIWIYWVDKDGKMQWDSDLTVNVTKPV